jgi:hypothetical protein
MKLLLLSALFITCSAMGMERDEACYTPKKEIPIKNQSGDFSVTKTHSNGQTGWQVISPESLSQRYKEYPDGSSTITTQYPDGDSFVSKLYTDGSSETKSFHKDGSSETTKTSRLGHSKIVKNYPDESIMVEKIYPDGSAIVKIISPDGSVRGPWKDWLVTDKTSDVNHTASNVKESNGPPTPLHFDVNPKNIESFGNIPKNDNKKKKENIVLNAKLHAWIQKPTDEYDHNRSRQEIDEPIRSIDNSVRKSGEYYSRTICDSMEKYSQLRKPIEMEKKIVLLNSGGFNREQLLEQMGRVTDKIEILTDEYAREFIRMRGDIPEDEIENHLEEVKQIIKDEWFKNYSHDIHMSCVVE